MVKIRKTEKSKKWRPSRTVFKSKKIWLFFVAFALVGSFLLLYTRAESPPPQDKIKSQTDDLVKLTKKLEKNPNDAALLNQIETLVNERKTTVSELMESDPEKVVQNKFPKELRTKLPQKLVGNIEEPVTLEGALEVSIGEDFDDESSDGNKLFYNYELKEAGGSHKQLHFNGDGPYDQANNKVKITGVLLESEVAVGADTAVETIGTTNLATPNAMRRVAVILINFTDNTTQPWTPTQVDSLMFGSTASVNAFYQESSYGTVGVTGDVFGWFTVPYASTSGCNNSTWSTSAVQQAGIDAANYDHILTMWDGNLCSWGGLATLGGRNLWIDGSFRVSSIAHEIGHNLGFHHASALSCTENGAPVAYSSTCTTSEYGDPFVVMGQAASQARSLGNYQRQKTGWLPEQNTITSAGIYTIAPTDLNAPTRLYRIARGDGTYLYLEYRQPNGEFSIPGLPTTQTAFKGVSIRIVKDVIPQIQTKLIDTEPSTTLMYDAPLVVGKSFTDPVSKATITTAAVTAAGATVTVSFNGSSPTDTTAPTVPASFTATATSSTSVNLSWTASTDNIGVAGYRIKRDGSIITTSTGTSFSNSGLTASTTYNYAITAYDAAGNESAAATVSVTTPSVDSTAPQVNLTSPAYGATVSGEAVVFAATASDDSGTVSRVEFSVDNIIVSTDTTAPYGYSWNSTTVANGSHTISARARDPAGNARTTSIIVTVENSSGDTTVPTVSISSPLTGDTVSGTVNVAATASDNVAVTKVEFQINGTLVATDTTSPYGYSWNTTTLTNGSHTVVATAYDAANNKASTQSAVTVNNSDTTPPSTPSGLSGTATSYNKISLNWTASTDNIGVTGYYIVRNGVTIATVATTSYIDASVTASSTYSYQVIAFDAKGNTSAISQAVNVSTPAAPDTTAPSVPTGLTASAVSTSQINLNWTASTDNVGVTGYDIYRNGVKIATVASTSFGSTGLSAATTYSYYVIARDAANNSSAASSTVSATTQQLPPPPVVSTGNLQGDVFSNKGGILAGATVSLSYNGSKRSYSTDSNGRYFISGIPAGNYSVKYSMRGGYTVATETVAITANQTLTKDVTLGSKK